MSYTGRFAPSPTGPLHFGSLIAAVGSYLQARSRHGKWLLRIEDLDPPREEPGAAQYIIETLGHYGFRWDDEISYQSARQHLYQHAIEQLLERQLAFPCACSRSEIAASQADTPAQVYSGTCRNGIAVGRRARSIRVKVDAPGTVAFDDLLQGRCRQDLAQTSGDFIIRRADGLYAYQLAVVVDDASQGITEVVRGCDLLDSTPRQIYLQSLLGLPTPAYLHLPVVVNDTGEKLSKQTHAPPLRLDNPLPALVKALYLLGQEPPPALLRGNLAQLWDWAIAHWDRGKIPQQRQFAPNTMPILK